jgi:tRNA threonylcarbamoyladenosine biosynthesis protein TsaE
MTFNSTSVADTEKIAADFARSLKGGQCVALHGQMGAGKTHFVRGMVMGLGGEPRTVSSPTYVLLNVYDTGRLTVFHLDAYRVQGPDDFDAIGFTELLDQAGVVVVEWPSRVTALLPDNTINIYIETPREGARTIRIG